MKTTTKMLNFLLHKNFLFSPDHSQAGGKPLTKKESADDTFEELTSNIRELERLNGELREARRAAFNLLEDAVQSKEALRKSEEKYRTKLEREVLERTSDLKKSQHQYVSLVENTPDVITRWNKYLKLVYANTAFADKTGKRLKDLYGKTSLEMAQPEEIAVAYMDSLRMVFETGKSFEHYDSFPSGDGEVFFHSRMVPEKNEKGEIETVLDIERDITELKKTEKEASRLKDELIEATLQTKEKLLKHITEATPTLLLRCSSDLRYLLVNRAAADFFGKPADNIVGKSIMEIIGQKAFEIIFPYVQRVLAGELVEYEARIPYPVGSRFMHVVYVPDFNDKNETIGWFATITDITERKKIEEDLRENEEQLKLLSASLEQEVTERTKELTDSENQVKGLDKSLLALTRELSGVNSELKTFSGIAANTYVETLRHLYINLEMIVTHDARNLSNSGRANLRRAQAAIQKMKLTTDDLVAFSKLSEIGAREDNVDLNNVLQAAINDFVNKPNYPPITINCDHLPSISGYPMLLGTLFHHLLDNAIKFRKEDNDHLIKIICQESVSGNEIALEGIDKNANYTIISITDNGTGFRQEESKKIFEMFYRIQDAGKHKGSGTGLAICKKIMEIHGGFITAEGVPDGGAIFHCYFPPPPVK